MILINASTRRPHVYLLATRNITFGRLLAQIIQLREKFSDYQIKNIWLDNVGESTSQSLMIIVCQLGFR
jgi:hypothetical protein